MRGFGEPSTIALPMLLVAFPTFEKWARQMMIPAPSMLIAIIALLAKAGDIINHKIVYGSSFETDNLRLGEGLESIFELCLLILAFEIFYNLKNDITISGNRTTNSR